MKRVAVFGNAGGKSTLARRLADLTGLPLLTHSWWVTKRLVSGHFVTPEGWPEGSPPWRSSLSRYRVLRLCHERLTPRYREIVRDAAATKEVHRLRSPGELRSFLAGVEAGGVGRS